MTDRTLVEELRDLITDWNGAEIPDSSLPRIDILCGTIRRAISALENQPVALADANSKDRELAEAREEIERLRGELAEAKAAIIEANNSLFGSQGYFLSLNGGPADKYHLSRAIEGLKWDTRLNHQMAEALKPFAAFAQWVDDEGWITNIHREGISVWFGPSDFRTALQALENGPAGFAQGDA